MAGTGHGDRTTNLPEETVLCKTCNNDGVLMMATYKLNDEHLANTI